MPYIGKSMSVRARQAYNRGEMPLSKWTKSLVLDYVDVWLKNHDVEWTRRDLNRISKTTLFELLLTCTSWHHTGEYYRRTDFYDFDDSFLDSLTLEKIQKYVEQDKLEAKIRKAQKKEEPKSYRALCEYFVWSGSRNHPKHKVKRSKGTIKGNWFYLENGKKKSIYANGFRVVKKLDKKED